MYAVILVADVNEPQSCGYPHEGDDTEADNDAEGNLAVICGEQCPDKRVDVCAGQER
jgi:hypothetical protein